MLQPRGKIRKVESRAKHSKSKDGTAHLHKVVTFFVYFYPEANFNRNLPYLCVCERYKERDAAQLGIVSIFT